MTHEERRQLDEQGFVVLENCMGVDLLRQLRKQISDMWTPRARSRSSR